MELEQCIDQEQNIVTMMEEIVVQTQIQHHVMQDHVHHHHIAMNGIVEENQVHIQQDSRGDVQLDIQDIQQHLELHVVYVVRKKISQQHYGAHGIQIHQ